MNTSTNEIYNPGRFSNEDGIRLALNRAGRYFAPPPKLLPSEFAEEYLSIPTSNAIPGPIRFHNAPHQREPLNMIVRPDVHTITLMWGAQTGKTQVQLMALAYYIAHDPRNQILMHPTESDLSKWLTNKFDPMVEACDSLKSRIAVPRGREGVNNKKMKTYTGGNLIFAWSGSPSTQRGISAPKIYCDEVDGYEKSREGMQINLLHQRNATFLDDRMLFLTSTPVTKGFSPIEDFYDEGDGRRRFVPCPDCGTHQVLVWEQVQWDKTVTGEHKPETAVYVCEECGSTWNDARRMAALRHAEWRAERPFDGHVSYHLPAMASLFVRLEDLVRDFLRKKQTNDLQSFFNLQLAESWEEGESIDETRFISRCEDPWPRLPNEIGLLTLGADVQKDRIEYEIVGWAATGESWCLEYGVLVGRTILKEVWDDFKDVLYAKFTHFSGDLVGISQALIDSGYETKRVYEFCKSVNFKVFPAKGTAIIGQPVIEQDLVRKRRHRKRNLRGIKPEIIGTYQAKKDIYGMLDIPEPGPGFCHFSTDLDEEYFKQLTGEKIISYYRDGRRSQKFVATRDRVEALDCRVLAYAAMLIYGKDKIKTYAEKKSVVAPKIPAKIVPSRRQFRPRDNMFRR